MPLLLTLLLACGTTREDDDDDGDDSGGLVEDTAPACATVSSGQDWAWNGECPQMRTPCDIVVEGCAMTIDYGQGGMTMGMPYAGTIDGDTITFENGDYVDGCVGTVADADSITGTCADGCTFNLRR